MKKSAESLRMVQQVLKIFSEKCKEDNPEMTKRWLSGLDYRYIPGKNHIDAQLNNPAATFNRSQIKEPLCDIILMPYLFQFHWLLLVIDVECSALKILDSHEKQTDSETRVVEAFTTFIKSLVEYAHIKPPMISQIVEYTSLTTYIECIERGISMDENLVPAKLRREMARAILRTSEDMKDCCLYCRIDPIPKFQLRSSFKLMVFANVGNRIQAQELDLELKYLLDLL
ncbi:hypothetical protein KQX54_018457 [Cotesia glomerata]|uniref:Ubiquitin-like protease family profile domain-containing protein n=1 Tax=Cotesia glomerata TaxID=32391 RepID=A0AAV7IUU3_COTGL|nr:hypothetical protein KQX54_018457 [Cotesia glomerata]